MAPIVSWWDELWKTWAWMEPSIFPLITNWGKGPKSHVMCVQTSIEQAFIKIKKQDI